MAILSYKDAQGLAHWPNAQLGKETYYGVEWDDFLISENDTITAITWTVPLGLTNMDEDQVLNQARIKLSADIVGKYEVLCSIDTIESVETQLFVQKMYIEVV